ncbi:MAG: AzlD domain-containing protein [Christensenellales bacterium]|jgi:branched-subunit amino acid transport protein
MYISLFIISVIAYLSRVIYALRKPKLLDDAYIKRALNNLSYAAVGALLLPASLSLSAFKPLAGLICLIVSAGLGYLRLPRGLCVAAGVLVAWLLNF